MASHLQTLRAKLVKASEYAREHELAAVLGRLTTVVGFLTVLALVALGLWVVTVVPHRYVQHILEGVPGVGAAQRLELEDTYRKTITQIVLGVFGLFLLYFTWRRSVAGDKTVRIAEQGHITDRFTKAIEQLGKMDGDKPNIEVRLGAIYALERIAIDSERDHWTIMEVLTAYVRQNAPLDPERPYTEGEKPRTDIQAILTVIGRRRTGPKRERPGQRLDLSESRLCGAGLKFLNLQEVNLRRVNLQEANLGNAILKRAKLGEADLQRARLRKANLQEVDLAGASLQEALLNQANLREAYLVQASLQRTILVEANLQNATLLGANLQEAYLVGANLEDARGVTVDQVKAALGWQRAHYSSAFCAELGLPPKPPDGKITQQEPSK